jgi:hypothetical protein
MGKKTGKGKAMEKRVPRMLPLKKKANRALLVYLIL